MDRWENDQRFQGGAKRIQRGDELGRQVEDDSAQGPVVRAKNADYRGWCPFCVAGKGKSESHRRMEASRDHGHPELHLDYAYMGREAEDRASPILVRKFSKDCWSVTHPVPCKGTQHRWIVGRLVNDVIMSGVQTLVIKSDQEASILDVKNALMIELRSIEGCNVMPEEPQVGVSAGNAVVERSVWEMQSTTRSLIAYAEWVHNTTFEPGSAILAWAVEYSGQVVSRFQRSVSDGKTAYEYRKQNS